MMKIDLLQDRVGSLARAGEACSDTNCWNYGCRNAHRKLEGEEEAQEHTTQEVELLSVQVQR